MTMEMDLAKRIAEGCAGLGVEVSPDAADRMARFAGLMLEANRSLNLTRIVEPNEVAIKHFVDSLSVLRLREVRDAHCFADVGTGAGFPGVPLAVSSPERSATLIDALHKRVEWLRGAVGALGLRNVELVHARAEDAGRGELRGRFDAVIARAVASVPVVLEYLVPLARVGGAVVLMRGGDGAAAVEEGNVAAQRLGCVWQRGDAFELPDGMGSRTLLVWRKERPTEKRYPRRAGVPARAPLGNEGK